MRLAITGSLDAAVFDSILGECQPCIQGHDNELVLDLSTAEWAYPSGLVPLAGLVNVLRSRGVQIRVDPYPDKSFCSYYCRMDFFRRIGVRSPCRTPSRTSGEGRFIELTELRHPQIEAETRTQLTGLLKRLPKGVEATDVSRDSFIDSCGELVSNTRHAYNQVVDPEIIHRVPALLQAQFYPRNALVEFCICDCGLGIKRSMEGVHHDQFASDLEAINAALAFMNRAPVGGGAGLGLAALESFIKKNGGIFRIRSGNALKVQRADRSAASTQQLPNWDGTIVTVRILVEKKADLSKISKRFAK